MINELLGWAPTILLLPFVYITVSYMLFGRITPKIPKIRIVNPFVKKSQYSMRTLRRFR